MENNISDPLLVMNINSIPNGMTATQVLKAFKEEKIVFWDSSNINAKEPKIMNNPGNIKIIDKNGK